MKVGIMTFPNSVSYGATLQMIALQSAVRRLGHQVEVINYHNPYMKAEKHTSKGSRTSLKGKVQRRISLWMHRRLYAGFRDFEARYASLYPRRPFTDKGRLPALGQRYDAVICGSDQVWYPHITNGDLSYFLDFCTESTRRIAYAPSFGAEEFPEAYYRRITPELMQFSALSAREEPGKRLVERLTGRETAVVTDPTFLMDVADWEKMEKPHPAATGDYVLYFVVRSSDTLLKRCREFARRKGLKLVVVGGNPLTARRNTDPMLEYALDVSPEQWLYLVHNARYVFTNSFHGTAFSVIFQRDFYVQYPPHNGSRLRQVVEALGMQDRELRDGVDPVDRPAPHAAARPIFNDMKARSLAYLENALT